MNPPAIRSLCPIVSRAGGTYIYPVDYAHARLSRAKECILRAAARILPIIEYRSGQTCTADSITYQVSRSDSTTEITSERCRLRQLFVLGIAIAGAVAFASCGGGASSAPDFEIGLYQGEDVFGSSVLNLSDLDGKPRVINFWAGLCPPCRAEMPDLQAFYNEFKDEIILVGIDVGPLVDLGSRNDGRNLLQELNISYPAGFSREGNPVRDYKILSMPTTVFITKDRKVFRKWAGLIDRNALDKITEEMLGESGSQRRK